MALQVAGGAIALSNNWTLDEADSGGTLRSILFMDPNNLLNLHNNALGSGGDIALYTGTTTTNGVYIKNGGNVGIGTLTPPYTFHVAPFGAGSGVGVGFSALGNGETDFYNYGQLGPGGFTFWNYSTPNNTFPTTGATNVFTIQGNGNTGIGTATPSRKLDIVDSSGVQLRFSAGSNDGGLGADGNGFFRLVGTLGGAIGTGSASQGTFTEVMRIIGTSVGIGTTKPQHMLHVAGTIGAEQVIVSSTGADYVFDSKYRLAPLREVASYVKENHHLPGIPAAEEMSKDGVSIGDLQTKLLAKIEEVTLHMIQAEQRNDQLEQQNHELQDRVARLESGRRKLKSNK